MIKYSSLAEALRTSDRDIPEGTFYGPLDDSQIRGIQLGERVGKELIRDHPEEIAEAYRNMENFQTLVEIAADYVHERHSKEVGRHAVAYALERILPSEEMEALRARRKLRNLESQVGGLHSPEAKARAIEVRRKIRETEGIGIAPDAMLKARGLTRWTEEERQRMIELTKDPTYQIGSGQHEGKPDYELIALELNIAHHGCNEIRHKSSVGNQMRDLRRKNQV